MSQIRFSCGLLCPLSLSLSLSLSSLIFFLASCFSPPPALPAAFSILLHLKIAPLVGSNSLNFMMWRSTIPTPLPL